MIGQDEFFDIFKKTKESSIGTTGDGLFLLFLGLYVRGFGEEYANIYSTFQKVLVAIVLVVVGAYVLIGWFLGRNDSFAYIPVTTQKLLIQMLLPSAVYSFVGLVLGYEVVLPCFFWCTVVPTVLMIPRLVKYLIMRDRYFGDDIVN